MLQIMRDVLLSGPKRVAPPSSLLSSLVSYWKMEEASGNRADSVGSNTLTPTNAPGRVAGKIGFAANLVSASSQSLQAPSNFVSTFANFMLSHWVKCSGSLSDFQITIDWGPPGSSNYIFWSYTNGSSGTAPKLEFAGTGGSSVVGPVVLATGVEKLITITLRDGLMSYYVDDQKHAAFKTTLTFATMGDWTSAVNSFGLSRFPVAKFDGSIDEVGLWNRRGTLREVLTLYNGGAANQYPFAAASPANLYLFLSFLNAADGTLRTYWSTDQLNWKETCVFYDTITVPGGPIKCRDPAVVFYGGAYWLGHTAAFSGGTGFAVAKSLDNCESFTYVTLVDVTSVDPAPTNVWFVHCFLDYDNMPHFVVNVSNVFYETHPTNATFTTWSALTPLTNTGSWPTTLAGGFMELIGSGRYRFWFDDGSTHYIHYAEAASYLGPFTTIKTGDWAGWGTFEGACPVPKLGGGFRMYADIITAGLPVQEGYSDCALADYPNGPWTPVQALPIVGINGSAAVPLNGQVIKVGNGE